MRVVVRGSDALPAVEIWAAGLFALLLAGLSARLHCRERLVAVVALLLTVSVLLGAGALAWLSPGRMASHGAFLITILPFWTAGWLFGTVVSGEGSLRATFLAAALGAVVVSCGLALTGSCTAVIAWQCIGGLLICKAALLAPMLASIRVTHRAAAPLTAAPLTAAPLAAALLLGAVVPENLTSLAHGWLFALIATGVGLLPFKNSGRAVQIAAVLLAAAAATRGLLFAGVPVAPVCAALASGCAVRLWLPRSGIELPQLCGAFAIGAIVHAALSLLTGPAAAITATAAIALFAVRSESSLGVWFSLVLAAISALQASATASPTEPCERVLAAVAAAEVRYRERDQALLLRTNGVLVDLAGPSQRHAELLAGLVRCALPNGGRVILSGTGTRRIITALADAEGLFLRAVDPSDAPAALASVLQQDGPVLSPIALPQVEFDAWVGGRRRFLWAQRSGSAEIVLAAEPLLRGAPSRASIEEHAAMRHAAGDGLVLQPFLLAETPPELLAAALAAASNVHPWCGVWLADEIGVIVGAVDAVDLVAMAEGYAHLPTAFCWRLHEAGIGCGADLVLAFVGALPRLKDPLHDDQLLTSAYREPPSCVANAKVLRAAFGSTLAADGIAVARLALHSCEAGMQGPAMQRLELLWREQPDSCLLRKELWQARIRKVEVDLAACDPKSVATVANMAALAMRFAHLGSPAAALQAALSLPDQHGERVRDVARAAEMALAIDPCFAESAPPVLVGIFEGVARFSPLFDLHRLPRPLVLAERCVGDNSFAVALRCRFRSACAHALVALWAAAPLPAAQLAVMRELADPFVLTQAATLLALRNARAEVLLAFPIDQEVPQGIAELVHGTSLERSQLMEALAYHTGPRAFDLLAQGLEDEVRSVRVSAGRALNRVAAGKVPYDPDWQESARQDAAARLRRLHNRTP